MHKPSRHRVLANEIQLVLALDSSMEMASAEELRSVRDLLFSALRPADMVVTSCEVSNRYVDARITFEDRINLANAMRSAKGTVAKQFAVLFPGHGPVFAQGYMSRTIGTCLPPEDAARLILSAGEAP